MRKTPFLQPLAAVLICLSAAEASAGGPALAPPTLRLPAGVRPTRYALELTVLPREPRHSGRIDIELQLDQPTAVLWLNATDLEISRAEVIVDGKPRDAVAALAGGDFLSVTVPAPVGPGKATLRLAFTGLTNRKETTGLFAQQDAGGEWYAFTQFESTFARNAFPCFDEPGFKVPWTLSVRVPKEHLAVSNTPIARETAGTDGLKTVVFKETQPLPAYLVALGVGPFDVVDAGKAGKKGVPLRIFTPKGKAGETAWAVKSTRELFDLLEDYFGIPYPYEKLDSLAIPQTVGFGAMENAGLITYKQTILLSRPGDETIGFARSYASIAAHEMAHQWFGDLVTMAWWDDTWLNESFATWMADKTIERWKPEWKERVSEIEGRSDVMGSDSLVSARKIRQPIATKDDIVNAFDGITYTKGGAVLSMFERYVGEERFRAGVKRYLTKHAFGNATADDFLAALSAEGGKGVAPAFATFLDQPGVPLVTASLVCGKDGKASLALSQKRYLPIGSKGSSQQVWQVPVCALVGHGGKSERVCTLMTGPTAELPLPGSTCPDWVLANDGAGYYRVSHQGDLLARLLADGGRKLALPARVALIGDVDALVASGELPLGEALAFVPRLLQDPSREIVSATAGLVGNLRRDLVSDSLRPAYQRFLQSLYGERARAIGFSPKPGEDDDTRLLRSRLVGLVTLQARDPKLSQEATRLATRWLDDRRAVDPEMIGVVLSAAARNGDRALFDRIHAEAKASKDLRERRRLIGALGAFRDPVLQAEAMKLFLTDEFDVRESFGSCRPASSRSPRGRRSSTS